MDKEKLNVYTANFPDIQLEWIVVVYVKAKNKKEANEKLSSLKLKNYSYWKASLSLLCNFDKLDTTEKNSFNEDGFLIFEAER